MESLAVDSGWDALSDTLKSVRPSLRSDSASRPASALTAVSDPVFRDVRNCAYRSLSRAVSFSARPRELTNTRVVWCFSTSSSTLRSMAGHTEPPVETREVCSSPPTEVSPLRSANASMQDSPRKYAWYGGSEVSRRLPSALRRRRRDRAWPKAVPPLSDPCRGAIRV